LFQKIVKSELNPECNPEVDPEVDPKLDRLKRIEEIPIKNINLTY
jgi:hypothetical protein